jgi:hypothetical protein
MVAKRSWKPRVPAIDIRSLTGLIPAMTSRYAHIFMDAQRAPIERVGAVVDAAGKVPVPEPVPLRGDRHGR